MPEAAIAARLSSGSPPRASCPCSPWQPGGPVWYSAWAWLQVVSARAAAHRPSAGVIVRRWRHRQAVSRSGCAAACMWGVGPPCSGGLSGAGAPLAFARATRRLGGVWRALLSIGRGGGGGVRRRLREAARAAGWSVALPEGGGKPGALLPTAGVNAGAPRAATAARSRPAPSASISRPLPACICT